MPKKNRGNRGIENGNTKHSQSVQLKNWFFTFNNYLSTDISKLEGLFKKICIRYVFQEETGENGTPHLQGSIHLKRAMRWSEFNLPQAIHWEKTRNNINADEYACKPETRTGQVYSFGMPKPIKLITSLFPWQQKIIDLILTEPDDRKINWFWESKGNIGKSALTKYLVVKYNALFCCGGKFQDIINLVYNSDMDKCNVIVFDIPRGHGGRVSFDTLECIKNGLICNTKYESGYKVFNPPHIIIFANFPPDRPEKLTDDKWNISEIS